MACNSCGSVNQGKFASEIEIYFPGLRNVNKRPVMYTLSLAFVGTKSRSGQLKGRNTVSGRSRVQFGGTTPNLRAAAILPNSW